ncbi:TetR/AcrR family transcriptional regulator [Secundilactobacillus malefermentans]|uniref:HTH tetR-type domain-containing protein n=1 Tax=Secundilactobacillus malefermentans TaxID=176292 RepID=A0A4R5NM72_9LACO|nr:TetR/AcrR family transcriptional regulator [Secundilactobacillus malefermentans]KRM55480.1 transcriptional regulator [Secundilactobacillus malefermentans DSM 5705 = KCTC 3548]QEA31598.1 TetR/AcrR family transcriptional regulator [Secundilactobacillus malefermentans]TDG76672.1 hypothetical protein C5L31_001783 [Secundilactobacillus malefermentans]
MAEEKVDLRTRRTKTQIEMAFFRLLKKKGFKALTVQDISKSAGVGRSTFYSHYYDKYDLLEKLVSTYTDQFAAVVRQRFNIKDSNAASETIKMLLLVLREYQEDLKLLLEVHTEEADLSRSFQHVLKVTVKEYLTGIQETNDISLPIDYLAEMYAMNVMTFLTWQLQHGRDDKVIEFGDRLQEIVLDPKLLDQITSGRK